MNLYSKTFYILNFQDFFFAWLNIARIRNLQVGLRVRSSRECFSKKINKKNRSKLRLKKNGKKILPVWFNEECVQREPCVS